MCIPGKRLFRNAKKLKIEKNTAITTSGMDASIRIGVRKINSPIEMWTILRVTSCCHLYFFLINSEIKISAKITANNIDKLNQSVIEGTWSR